VNRRGENTGRIGDVSQRVLVAGVGNLFLGDDGFGPEVARRLPATGRVPAHVRVVDYGIRGMHLAYDLLEGYDALVLVDALPGGGAPGDLRVLEVREEDLGSGELDAHGMHPVAVLASLRRLGGSLPPTYVVGCRPATVEESIGLSDAVEAAIPAAVDAVLRLVDDGPPAKASGSRGRPSRSRGA
jgi:hydrogenase maturation protease